MSIQIKKDNNVEMSGGCNIHVSITKILERMITDGGGGGGGIVNLVCTFLFFFFLLNMFLFVFNIGMLWYVLSNNCSLCIFIMHGPAEEVDAMQKEEKKLNWTRFVIN